MKGKVEDLTGVTIASTTGRKYKIQGKIGQGAQGVVYSIAGEELVVKLYYPTGSQAIEADILERIKCIKNIKVPRNFVAITDIIEQPYIGYVMEKVEGYKPLNSYLIPDRNKSFPEWYNSGLGLYERLFIGYIIAKAFVSLEKQNLSYCDISGNNILVRVVKGASVKMIDVDNIYTPGRGAAAILGTPRYIAPEVVSGLRSPDVLSDNYSLAVILFELLRVGHPYISDDILDGTPEDEEQALNGNADYVTEENSTNMLPADVVFTDKLSKLFERCFVDGKVNRLNRPSASEFQNALLDATNKIIKCPNCGAWHYPRKKNGAWQGCPWCDTETKPKARLNFYDILFAGNHYQTLSQNDIVSIKLENTFIIKENRKNYVKGFYLLNSSISSNIPIMTDNYVSIVHNGKGYYVYNAFSKNGIIVKQYKTQKYYRIENNMTLLLETGDEIYFEMDGTYATKIHCGGKEYSYIKMARFMEV